MRAFHGSKCLETIKVFGFELTTSGMRSLLLLPTNWSCRASSPNVRAKLMTYRFPKVNETGSRGSLLCSCPELPWDVSKWCLSRTGAFRLHWSSMDLIIGNQASGTGTWESILLIFSLTLHTQFMLYTFKLVLLLRIRILINNSLH